MKPIHIFVGVDVVVVVVFFFYFTAWISTSASESLVVLSSYAAEASTAETETETETEAETEAEATSEQRRHFIFSLCYALSFCYSCCHLCCCCCIIMPTHIALVILLCVVQRNWPFLLRDMETLAKGKPPPPSHHPSFQPVSTSPNRLSLKVKRDDTKASKVMDDRLICGDIFMLMLIKFSFACQGTANNWDCQLARALALTDHMVYHFGDRCGLCLVTF